jgi:hypothetical protein
MTVTFIADLLALSRPIMLRRGPGVKGKGGALPRGDGPAEEIALELRDLL